MSYLEQKFSVSKSDLAKTAKSDLAQNTGETWPKEPNNNIEENREENTVNGSSKLIRTYL
jgi:hypothetical protein